ncbi:MAG: glycosyltransferase family 9 protein [Candidatus Marinarcus sp.]|uniref:glycosyltransferase family 9 protein n=1 Tax=Candidatus Marinarcus sp. TaxID=3100987 RepID=UPI003B0098C2
MKKILVIRFSALGDLVTLEPTFRAFRYFFKNDHITLLTTGVGKGLFQDTDYFNEYIMHQNVFKSWHTLKDEKFDLIINLQCNKPSHYISMFLDKKAVVNKSYNLFQKILKIKTHSKSVQEMIEAISWVNQNMINDYFQSTSAQIMLPVLNQDDFFIKEPHNKYIAISTGTSERWLSKKWGAENYLNLIKKLIIDKYKVILIGSNLEIEDAQYILNHFKENEIVSFVDKTNLTQLKNILAKVDLFVGNDTGPAHIASGVGTNTITIFGSTDIQHSPKFMPYSGTHEYLKPSDSISCHPCYKAKCPTNMECMKSIKVEDVMKKIQGLL